MAVEKILSFIKQKPDLMFAIILAFFVYCVFAFTNDYFMTHRTTFAIMERFAVLGLVGLALTLCIIAGEIDLSIGSNAALAAVIVVRFTDSLGAPTALLIAVAVSTIIGLIQGYFIAYLRIRAIVLTVGTLMLLRGISLFVAEEKTVMLTDFRIPDFITTKVLWYFSPASLTVIAMFVLVGLFMNFTKYGREIYAIGGARKEALAAGISLKRPMIIVFAISGFCSWSWWCNYRVKVRYRSGIRSPVPFVSRDRCCIHWWRKYPRWKRRSSWCCYWCFNCEFS